MQALNNKTIHFTFLSLVNSIQKQCLPIVLKHLPFYIYSGNESTPKSIFDEPL